MQNPVTSSSTTSDAPVMCTMQPFLDSACCLATAADSPEGRRCGAEAVE